MKIQRASLAAACFALAAFQDPASQPTPGDVRKREIEQPIKDSLSALVPAAQEHAVPGLVPWHASVDVARAAARESGKPVLVFQMLGRLDDAMC